MKRAALLALIPLLAACSGAPAPAGEQSPATSPSAGPSPSAAPSSTWTPAPYTPPPSFTAAEQALIKAEGRTVHDSDIEQYLDSAHTVCETVVPLSDEAVVMSLQQVDEATRGRAGRILLHLCDDAERFTPLVVAVEMGGVTSGTYYVGDGEGELKPGEYKTVGAAQDCYWVRKDKDGGIIANDLVANAPGGVRMTVKASDYEVTMERCGIWIPA